MVLLENSRMFRDFIYLLYRNFKNQNKSFNELDFLDQDNDLNIFVDKEISECCDFEKDNGNNSSTERYCLMNQYGFYVQQYEKDKNCFDKDTTIKSITNYLKYYTILNYFKEHHEFEDSTVFYLFEELCNKIKEILSANRVYFIYSKDGEVLETIAQSGYIIPDCDMTNEEIHDSIEYTDIEKYELTNNDEYLHKIISFRENKEVEEKSIVSLDNIFIKNYSKKENHEFRRDKYLLMKFKIDDVQDNCNKQEIIMLVDYSNRTNDEFTENNIIKDLFYILFVRYNLETALNNNYDRLLALRIESGFIKKLYNETDDLNIMHISDLHVNESNTNNYGNFLNGLNKEENKKYELIAITGDIVQASASAYDAQAKYYNFEHLITKLAKELWGKGKEKRLPSDWKRRILIVPGNHDYTIMSDVFAEESARRVKVALPSKHAGGILSRYTYFIEFMGRFFDMNLVEYVSNDLNEIRQYHNLKLNVLLLNSVANANSLQNNKVGFSDKIKWMFDRQQLNQSYKNIVLQHHSPNYKINYFDDKYYYKMSESNKDAYRHAISVWETYFTVKDQHKVIEIDTSDPELLKSEFYYDLQIYNDIAGKKSRQNEFDVEFETKIRNLSEMQVQDQKLFNKSIELINNKLNNNVIYLVGHEHCTKFEYYDNGRKNDNIKIYVINKHIKAIVSAWEFIDKQPIYTYSKIVISKYESRRTVYWLSKKGNPIIFEPNKNEIICEDCDYKKSCICHLPNAKCLKCKDNKYCKFNKCKYECARISILDPSTQENSTWQGGVYIKYTKTLIFADITIKVGDTGDRIIMEINVVCQKTTIKFELRYFSKNGKLCLLNENNEFIAKVTELSPEKKNKDIIGETLDGKVIKGDEEEFVFYLNKEELFKLIDISNVESEQSNDKVVEKEKQIDNDTDDNEMIKFILKKR